MINRVHWTPRQTCCCEPALGLLPPKSLNFPSYFLPLPDRNNSSSPPSTPLAEKAPWIILKDKATEWSHLTWRVGRIRTHIPYFCHPDPVGRTRHTPRPHYPKQNVTYRPYGSHSRSSGGVSWCSKDKLGPLASSHPRSLVLLSRVVVFSRGQTKGAACLGPVVENR